MIMAGTGHRPDKLGGYSNTVFKRLVSLAEKALLKFKPDKVISGMAIGWDQALAQGSINVKIPFIAAIPFKGQECKWSRSQKDLYVELLEEASEQIIVCDGAYSPAKMQKRNIWMIDHCDQILALWNGSSGGTGNCIEYAQKQEKPIINLWGSWEKYKGI